MSRINWTDEKLFSRLLNNKSDRTYWESINVLRKRPTKEIFEKCIELTKSRSPKQREIGIDILAQLGHPPRPFYKESNNLFFELIESEKEPKVIMSILFAIGHNQEKLTKIQIDKLCEFKNTENSLIKEGLVSALNGIDKSKAIETLIYLSNDKLNYIRNWATFGIGTQIDRNNKKITEALWNRINDKHQETKLEAIVGLAKRKDIRVKEIAQRELLAGEYGTLLFEAILEVGDTDFFKIMKEHYKTESKNENINPEWLKDLQNCITELSKKIKTNG